MTLRHVLGLLWMTIVVLASYYVDNSTYLNPILPGWNSDPSCIFSTQHNNTFFCTTSTFLTFPGIPVYASKDLQNWKLISHALTRSEQLPELSFPNLPRGGLYASTLRFHNGTYYIITAWVDSTGENPVLLRLFNSTDPFQGWNGPVAIENPRGQIDPDIFWDDDGKVYMAVAQSYISEIDITTGKTGETSQAWNGTGGTYPEGPHLYKKDGYYYLLIAEGGTENNHTVTLARSRDIRGPWESDPDNPFLTAKNTPEYFQTVGHADLLQDAAGNWWGLSLATRSGPEWEIYPMGRETVLFPVTWEEGKFPVADTVRGKMSGPLPPIDKDLPIDGPFWDEPDVVDFTPGSSIPKNFMFYRPPKDNVFAISPADHPNTLRIMPSRVNLTTDAAYDPIRESLGFIARKQTGTLFKVEVDLLYSPTIADEEAGVTVFLTEYQHIDLSITARPDPNGTLVSSLKFRVEASGRPDLTVPEERIVPVPAIWRGGLIRLEVSTPDDVTYTLSASQSDDKITLGSASASVVSGGTGPFTGTLIGLYATSNGGNGSTPAYFSRWRYNTIAQEIAAGEFVSTLST